MSFDNLLNSEKEHSFLTKMLNYLVKLNEPNRFSIEDFCKQYSEKLDDYILSVEAEEQISYKTGNFTLKLIGEEEFKVNIDLYFHKSGDNWVNKRDEGLVMDMRTTLNDEAISELLSKKELNFDVEKPKR